MWILKKYWKLIAAIVSISLLIGSMYFLYSKNISLTKENQQYEIALEASENTIEALQEDRARVDKTNKRNAERKAEIASELERARRELSKLKRKVVENEEKGSECLGVDQPASIVERMHQRSNPENRVHSSSAESD